MRATGAAALAEQRASWPLVTMLSCRDRRALSTRHPTPCDWPSIAAVGGRLRMPASTYPGAGVDRSRLRHALDDLIGHEWARLSILSQASQDDGWRLGLQGMRVAYSSHWVDKSWLSQARWASWSRGGRARVRDIVVAMYQTAVREGLSRSLETMQGLRRSGLPQTVKRCGSSWCGRVQRSCSWTCAMPRVRGRSNEAQPRR